MEWRTAWNALLTETLQGNDRGTWYVQGREALLPILRGLSAERASARPTPTVNSIAAHVHHTAYYMELAGRCLGTNVEEHGDWEGSWSVQTVDADGWKVAIDRLESAAEQLTQVVASREITSQDDLTYAWANVAHLAFHLGSIRQLAQVIYTEDQ